jgi:excisionase family DNA binding protein
MDKKSAAQYLGISTRALEYHVTQGHIGRRMVKGKTGDVADFDESELRKLRAQLDEKRAPRPAVVSNESSEGEPRSLTRLSDASQIQGVNFLLEVLSSLSSSGKAVPASVGIESKLLLTRAEVQALTGLSQAFIKEAIDSKKLKAQRIGRADRIKRTDLDAFIKKL